MPNEKDLSEREREILRLVATGASNKEIAQTLVISTNTVKVHLRNIFAKIEVTSRTEATLFAIRLGLVQSPINFQGMTSPQNEKHDWVDNDHQGSASASLILPGQANVDPFSTRKETGRNIIQRLFEISPIRRALYFGGAGVLLFVLVFFAIQGASILIRGSGPTPTQDNSLTQPSQPRWESLGAMPAAVSGLAAAVYENQIYIIGGDNGQGVTGAVATYIPSQKSWLTLASKPTPVADVNAAVMGGLIYVPGGRLASGQATAVLEVYDPQGDSWESKASLPVAVWGYALAGFEGKLYLFGGWDGQKALAGVYVYDPESDQWATRSSMPGPRAFTGAAFAAGKIYVMGGFDGTKALDTNQAYIPERDQSGEIPWVEQARLPKARYSMGMTSLVDTIYLIGGKGDSSAIEYVAPENDWRALDTPLAQIDSGLTLVPFVTYIYTLGGIVEGKTVGEMQVYKAIYTISMPVVR